jgi:hypothetical protein
MMRSAQPTELTVTIRRRRGTEQASGDGPCFADYDIAWPDGQPVGTGLKRFCSFGSRLLLGRRYNGEAAWVRLIVHPVAGREASLTRPGPTLRCRRLYALRSGDNIRLYFLDGTPTEAVFHASFDEQRVLRWLQVEHMQPGEPFWFDLACQTLPNSL